MIDKTESTIVPATASDALAVAELINIAGDGIPEAIWHSYAPAGQLPLDFGTERAAVGEGGFSWRNAHMMVTGAGVAGMLLAYPLPDSEPDDGDLHPLEYPFVKLEALARGSFYINAVAVYPDARGRGLGRRLMDHAMQLARAQGCHESSLIVFSRNRRALSLYQKLGYLERARQPPIEHPDFCNLGDCLLLVNATLARRGGRSPVAE